MTTSDNKDDSQSGNGGFLDSAIEKGGDFADSKTGDKYETQVDKGQDFARDKFGNSDKSGDAHKSDEGH